MSYFTGPLGYIVVALIAFLAGAFAGSRYADYRN